MTFLALDFWCTPPPNHSGDISVNWKFATNPVGTRGLPLGEDRCWPTCRPFKVFTSERRQESLGPSNSSYVCYGIIYRNRPTQEWSNTVTAHWWQHRRVVVLSFFLSSISDAWSEAVLECEWKCNLFWFIEVQTHFITSCHAKRSLTLDELILKCSSLKPPQYLQGCTKNLPEH